MISASEAPGLQLDAQLGERRENGFGFNAHVLPGAPLAVARDISLLARLTLPAPMVMMASPAAGLLQAETRCPSCIRVEIVDVLVARFANGVGQRFAGHAVYWGFAGGDKCP